jgi:hypothetical protein
MRLILLTLTSFLFSPYANSAIYKYHPYSTLSIGGGFNPFNPREQYLRCITHDGIGKRRGPVSTEVEISFVKSTSDLYNKLNFSSSLEGSFMFLDGQTSLSYLSEHTAGSEKLSWVMLFRTRFANYQLINPTLKKQYSGLSYENLLDICGSEIATTETRTAMIYAMFTFNNLSEHEKSQLKSKIGLTAKSSSWNASLKASYEKLVDSFKFSQDISISINALGGEGVQSLAGLVDDGNLANYQSLPNIMHNYIKNLSEENAVPTSYSTTQLTSFLQQPASIQKKFNKKNFSKIYDKYVQTEQNLERIQKILTSFSLNQAKQQRLQEIEQEYYEYLKELEEAATKCFEEKNDCIVPTTKISNLNIIKNYNNKCEEQRELALSSGMIGPSFYLMAQKRNFIPVFENNKMIEWIPCNL